MYGNSRRSKASLPTSSISGSIIPEIQNTHATQKVEEPYSQFDRRSRGLLLPRHRDGGSPNSRHVTLVTADSCLVHLQYREPLKIRHIPVAVVNSSRCRKSKLLISVTGGGLISSLVTPKSKLPCSASVCGGTASGTTTPSEQDSRKDAETRDKMLVCYVSLVDNIW